MSNEVKSVLQDKGGDALVKPKSLAFDLGNGGKSATVQSLAGSQGGSPTAEAKSTGSGGGAPSSAPAGNTTQTPGLGMNMPMAALFTAGAAGAHYADTSKPKAEHAVLTIPGNNSAALSQGRMYRGVDLDLMKWAVAGTESADKTTRLQANPEKLRGYYRSNGYPVGYYQFMTENPFAKAEIDKIPGGAEWRTSLSKDRIPTAQEVEKFFPKEAEERVMDSWVKSLIDRSIDKEGLTKPLDIAQSVGALHMRTSDGAISDNEHADQNGRTPAMHGIKIRGKYEQLLAESKMARTGVEHASYAVPAYKGPLQNFPAALADAPKAGTSVDYAAVFERYKGAHIHSDEQIAQIAQECGFHITSSNSKGERHRGNTRHKAHVEADGKVYEASAHDLRSRDHTVGQLEAFIKAAEGAGFNIVREDQRLPGYVKTAQRSGDHLHMEVKGAGMVCRGGGLEGQKNANADNLASVDGQGEIVQKIADLSEYKNKKVRTGSLVNTYNENHTSQNKAQHQQKPLAKAA